MNRLRLIAGASIVAMNTFVASAFAQSPAEQVYGGQGGNVQQDVAGEGVASGALPFTGMDLALMAIAALLLVATGLVIRRLTRTKSLAT
jgi:hypothetical protein